MSPERGSPRFASVLVGAVAAGAYALALTFHLIPKSMSTVVSAALVAFPFVIGVEAYRAARRHTGRTRRGWLWIAWTLLVVGIYNVAWIAMLATNRPIPPAFSLGFLVLIPLGMVGVLNLAVLRDRSSTLRRTCDGVFIAGSVFLISWCLILRTLYVGSSGSVATRIATLSYPMSDILILSLVIFLATRYRTDGTTPLTYIAMSLVVWSIADSTFAYLTFRGEYYAGHPVEVGWLVGYGLLFLAAHRAHPVASHEDAAEELPRVELPYGIGSVALVVGITAQIVRDRVDAVVLFTLIGLAMLALARQFLALVEHQRYTIKRLRALDETKTNILRAVSHELRTPLTFIKGTSALLGEQWHEMPEETIDMLFGRVNANCDRLDELLGSLLDLDRLSRGVIEPTRQPTDIRALIERVASSVNMNQHAVSVIGDAGEASVDPGQIERVVENLLVNAVRHTPPGTRVAATCVRDESGVLITVSDDGPGVPAEIRPTIFDPFVQSEASVGAGRGTGIGLSLVAKFTELHGGRVWVDESSAGGAEFGVYLPDVAAA